MWSIPLLSYADNPPYQTIQTAICRRSLSRSHIRQFCLLFTFPSSWRHRDVDSMVTVFGSSDTAWGEDFSRRSWVGVSCILCLLCSGYNCDATATVRLLCRADNGSHFMTHNPRDPSVNWPVMRVTRDPWPMTHDYSPVTVTDSQCVTFVYPTGRGKGVSMRFRFHTVPTPSLLGAQ